MKTATKSASNKINATHKKAARSAGSTATAVREKMAHAKKAARATLAEKSGGQATRPPKRRRENTKAALMVAARKILAESGVGGASVERICEEAGFTRGAFYSNFADMPDLVRQIIEAEYRGLADYLEENVTPRLAEIMAVDVENREELLHEYIAAILMNLPLDRHFILLQSEIELYAMRNPDVAGPIAELTEVFLRNVIELVERALQQAHRRSLIGARDLTVLLVTLVRRSWMPAVSAHGGADPDNFAKQILPGLLLGLTEPLDDKPLRASH